MNRGHHIHAAKLKSKGEGSIARIAQLEAELQASREALRALWIGTVWGAGKAAAFEFHRLALREAGVPDIGD